MIGELFSRRTIVYYNRTVDITSVPYSRKVMFKSYLVVAWRNLWRNKGFSAINIIGLAIGMASAVIILLWIQNEVSFDRFHEKGDRIYQAWNRVAFNGKVMTWDATPKILA